MQLQSHSSLADSSVSFGSCPQYFPPQKELPATASVCCASQRLCLWWESTRKDKQQMNICALAGRLVRNGMIRGTERKVLLFTLETRDGRDEGDQKERVNFVPCVM